ncbi:helix-turn-helix transcriptional regulator [Acidovorax sp. SDU_ACID1]|uniref:helix-turn-helix transcriptional regulator n=1 Tax=Acidovorax sp. SDU_ACID1 TaxID=3136632 RepID=UPI00387393A0
MGSSHRTRWLRSPPIRGQRELRAFQDEFTQFLSGIQVEPLHGHPLAMEGSLTSIDGMLVNIGHTTPTRCIHPASGADDAVMLMGVPVGRLQLQLHGQGRECGLESGDAVFSSPGRHLLVAPSPAHLCGVLLSRSLLESMSIDVDAALLRPQRAHPAAALLMRYAYLLRDHDALATPGLRRAAVLHMHDLAALLAGATGDAAHQARGRGGRAARLAAVQQDIAAHLTDPQLSVAGVARRQGVTPRYLQMLLEEAGETFTALVLAQRLALARRLLADPRLRRRTVSDIALDAGFGDLSYFNRSFRRRYGMTPTESRACAPQS